jgi:hypothetical protein
MSSGCLVTIASFPQQAIAASRPNHNDEDVRSTNNKGKQNSSFISGAEKTQSLPTFAGTITTGDQLIANNEDQSRPRLTAFF